jgi:hypothetical protein
VHDSIYKKFAVEFRALLTEGTIKVKLAMP